MSNARSVVTVEREDGVQLWPRETPAHLSLVHRDDVAELWHGDALQGLPCDVDCIITDPPYSERVHSGHDRQVANCRREEKAAMVNELDYSFWTDSDIAAACKSWSERCRGWIVILTDHESAQRWAGGLELRGRYVFAPLPFLSPGSRVRLAGDGPSSWTCWIIVARPKRAPYSKWGTLPGGYVFPTERMEIVGGKPLALMNALVQDYSREGDVVCDPCMGAGTTGRAAIDLGRRFVGVDISAEHCALAAKRLEQQPLFGASRKRAEQSALSLGGDK